MIDANNLSENNENALKIEYWTVSANRYAWYITALLGAGLTAAFIIIYSKNKEKKDTQKFEVNN